MELLIKSSNLIELGSLHCQTGAPDGQIVARPIGEAKVGEGAGPKTTEHVSGRATEPKNHTRMVDSVVWIQQHSTDRAYFRLEGSPHQLIKPGGRNHL